MKIVVLIILALHGIKCTSFQFPDLKHQYQNVPLVNIIGVNESILYFKENVDGMLLHSILGNLNKQPILLVSGENITIKAVNKKNPNIILLTETPNIDDFKTQAFKTLLFSYWSLLHLVMTTRSDNYRCENGTLNKIAFAETKNYLNELWHEFRIVQVAVSFPYTCPKHYVIYAGKEWSGSDLYNRSIKLIEPKNNKDYANAIAYSGDPRYLTNGYPLRANIFYRLPTAIIDCNEVAHYTDIKFGKINKYCGLDGLVMHDYIEHYKYELSMPVDNNCDKYGFENIEHNNTITGSLGCIVRNEIDISFNSRFVWLYTKEKYFYLHYIAHDSWCVILKRPSNIPLWHYAYTIFTPLVWIVLLTSLAFLGALTWLSAKITPFLDENPIKLHSYLYNAIHSALFGILVKNDGKFLILKGTSLLCSILLIAVYQQHFNYQFTTRTRHPGIKSLEQLYNSQCSLYTSQAILEVVKGALNENNAKQAAFLKRIRIDEEIRAEFIIKHSNTGTVGRKQDVMIEALKNFTDDNGVPMVYIVDECFYNYYLSYIARNNFLFLDESLKFMMRLVEAGLPDRYYIWTRRSYNVADQWPGSGPVPRPFKSIKQSQLRVIFGFLLLGYVVSGLIFIVERCKRT